MSADEVGDPHNLRLRMLVNGVAMQDSSTSGLIFSINRIIAHITQVRNHVGLTPFVSLLFHTYGKSAHTLVPLYTCDPLLSVFRLFR